MSSTVEQICFFLVAESVGSPETMVLSFQSQPISFAAVVAISENDRTNHDGVIGY